MNCEDCKEQVLELVEREAVDPEGVRETLAKCPECRAEFDEVKAQLAIASQLPLEAPPDHLDVLILQAAEARAAGAAPAIGTLIAEESAAEVAVPTSESRPPLFLWRQPLAMAAVALLVVAIGVSIVRVPRREQMAEAPAVAEDVAEAAALEDLEEAAEGREPERIEIAQVRPDDAAALGAAAEPPAAKKARTTVARSAKKREARRAGQNEAAAPIVAETTPQRVAVAEADQAPAPAGGRDDASELASLKSGESKQASAFEQASEDRGATTEKERRCLSTILVFEKRQKDKRRFDPTPEQALDAGLCYQLLGKGAEAERWLKRAAEHPSTKARANAALENLSSP